MENQSLELQSILNTPPKKIIKWGTTLIAILLIYGCVLLLKSSFTIKYDRIPLELPHQKIIQVNNTYKISAVIKISDDFVISKRMKIKCLDIEDPNLKLSILSLNRTTNTLKVNIISTNKKSIISILRDRQIIIENNITLQQYYENQ